MSAPYASTVLTGNGAGSNGAGSIADRRPLLLAAAGASCISASAILVKLAGTGAATTAFYRCGLALPVLVMLALTERRRHGPRPWTAHRGALVAGLLLSVDLVLWNHAIAEVGAGIATVLGNLQVLFVALAAWALFSERPERRFLVALPVVMVGVVLVSGLVGGRATGETHPLAGIGYGIGTSLAYAAFLLIFRRSSAGAHVAAPLAEATAGAALGSLVLGLVFGELQWRIGWPAFGWLLLLSLTSQTIGWLLITSSLPRLSAAISSLILLLQPAASMLLAFVVLGERPTLIQVAGAVVVCVGVLAASRSTPAPRDVSPRPAEAPPGPPVPPGPPDKSASRLSPVGP
ncbi:MAG TPA: DMT family transporter [Streptosporangiaceae bacterium]|jgi:drug/metabolite transporter (DMT)-like permease|nr:DMT family transporter [Streptosporangiaceae bacterium]